MNNENKQIRVKVNRTVLDRVLKSSGQYRKLMGQVMKRKGMLTTVFFESTIEWEKRTGRKRLKRVDNAKRGC